MYSNKVDFSDRPRVLVDTQLNDHEHPVQAGLAIPPSEIDRMRMQGIPVSSSNLEYMYYDGVPDPSFDLPIDFHRGIDAADVWNASKIAQRNVSRAKKKMADAAYRFSRDSAARQAAISSIPSQPNSD